MVIRTKNPFVRYFLHLEYNSLLFSNMEDIVLCTQVFMSMWLLKDAQLSQLHKYSEIMKTKLREKTH